MIWHLQIVQNIVTILDAHLVVASDPVLVDGNVFGVQELAAGAVLAWNTKEMLE